MEDRIEVDVLDESEGMETLLAGHEPEGLCVIMEILESGTERKAGKQKKEGGSAKQAAAAIVKVLKQRPKLLEKLLCAEGICLLEKMSRDRRISLRECIVARDDLGMMNILGLVLLEEKEGGILYMTQEAVEFASRLMEGENGKRLEKKAERERLFLSILQFYQVMEADRLYEMFLALYPEDCSRQEFEEIDVYKRQVYLRVTAQLYAADMRAGFRVSLSSPLPRSPCRRLRRGWRGRSWHPCAAFRKAG